MQNMFTSIASRQLAVSHRYFSTTGQYSLIIILTMAAEQWTLSRTTWTNTEQKISHMSELTGSNHRCRVLFMCAQTVVGQCFSGNGPNGLSYYYYYCYHVYCESRLNWYNCRNLFFKVQSDDELRKLPDKPFHLLMTL